MIVTNTEAITAEINKAVVLEPRNNVAELSHLASSQDVFYKLTLLNFFLTSFSFYQIPNSKAVDQFIKWGQDQQGKIKMFQYFYNSSISTYSSR